MITLAGGGFLQAKLTAVPSGGIKTVSLVAGGSGYSATPQTLTLVQSGAASGTVTCTITGGVVTAITAVSAVGTGYSVASTLATTGGGGTNCTITINEIYQPSFICNYIDTNDIPGVTTGYLNGTTAVTILESPPTGQRMLDLGIIFNADKATVTPIIELVSGGNTVEIHPRQSLAINQTLQFGRQTEGVLDIDDYLLITDIDDTPIDSATDTAISSNWAYDHVAAADPHTGYVLETLFDAYTMLYADTNNTPAIVTLAASQIPGRKSTGGIVALAKSDLQTIINVADGATANDMAAPGAIGGTTPAAITGTTIIGTTINGVVTGWTQTVGTFTAAPASTSTITMTTDLTATILVGYPLKYVIGGVTYYGIVTAIAANLLTVAGAPLGGNVTALYYGDPNRVRQVTYDNSASTSVLTTGTVYTLRWSLPKAYLVLCKYYQTVADTTDNGKVTVKINGTETNTSAGGVTIVANTTWYGTVVDIATAAYDVNTGEDVTIVVTQGTSVDGYGLKTNMVFVTP